ncbi:prephenate/arogenate dehydrogenase family protein [Sphingomonas carotinifaciens]|uniref:prephenate dehydrogenase n=1 Tax=Sphingomonas carotinifaciens TaxID=1166323 RepID=A0A1G7N3I3_9SPHN|nr:prephenate/arogenate dehydrogenase family protein [Sphingomonas carotinifaciens]MBB4087215.1 cyclohexadieny/prephenate dehydrogenase [Sphingomonas carotinifaciens]MWC43100.1 prephenate/arogenate dehydrogenase family protein [Sphingomonas carotinifaciens]SDF68501.1 cyclohexadieny/prephenate dehydrogenase [Sphingomonas carotinifaciens]
MLPFARVTIIGLGLIGSSIARGVKKAMPGAVVTAYDADPSVRDTVHALGIADDVADSAGAAVVDADLVILCVPVGAMAAVAVEIAEDLPADAVVSDVGSSKASVFAALRGALPGATIVPGHPVAGTEHSGPESGFATLFQGRWCILTPEDGAESAPVIRLRAFWEALGAQVELMSPKHHDLVLAVTSHVPHLIAYSIVGTASDLEEVTRGEVIKYSAGGFRDFTRIAASDPTMWRDVFLNNREAVLEILQRLTEDVTMLQRAIRWGDGDTLFDLFTRTRAIRRGVIDQGQDDARPDFGRAHGE